MDMTEATDELVRQVTSIPQELGAAACFGQPLERDGHVLIPVARVNFGYGLGFGGGSSEGSEADEGSDGKPSPAGSGGGGGGGGGGGATPVAIIDVGPEGVKIEAIRDTTRITIGAFVLAAWNVFWLTWTVRSFFHQRAKVRRLEIDRAE